MFCENSTTKKWHPRTTFCTGAWVNGSSNTAEAINKNTFQLRSRSCFHITSGSLDLWLASWLFFSAETLKSVRPSVITFGIKEDHGYWNWFGLCKTSKPMTLVSRRLFLEHIKGNQMLPKNAEHVCIYIYRYWTPSGVSVRASTSSLKGWIGFMLSLTSRY